MFCPTCGSQIPDSTKFCPSCGTSVTPGANAPTPAPAPTPQKQKKEPGKTRKLLFGSMSVGGIIVLILVTQIGKYVAKKTIPGIINPEPSAIEQPADPETDTSDEDPENLVMEEFGDHFSLTDCRVRTEDSQAYYEMFSSVMPESSDAEELSARFSQTLLTNDRSQSVAEIISENEQSSGVTGITLRYTLYYADGTICGEALFDNTGLVDYRI